MTDARPSSTVVVCDRAPLLGDVLVRGLQLAGLDARAAVWGQSSPATPGLVLLDATPAPEDVAAAAAALGCGPAPLLLLAARGGPGVEALSRRLGATAVVSRERSLDDLAAAARLALTGAPVPDHLSPRPDPADEGLDSLTVREREVLALLATGARNDAVAQRLQISPHTVRTHVQNVLLKLGVENRIAAAAVARRSGLLASAAVVAGAGR